MEPLVENLKKQVTCSICLDTYTDPKILSCFHTFCCKCLEEHARNTHRQGKFRCPECQAEIDLPEGNRFDRLSTSFIHNSLLGLLETEDREVLLKPPFCSQHKKERLRNSALPAKRVFVLFASPKTTEAMTSTLLKRQCRRIRNTSC